GMNAARNGTPADSHSGNPLHHWLPMSRPGHIRIGFESTASTTPPGSGSHGRKNSPPAVTAATPAAIRRNRPDNPRCVAMSATALSIDGILEDAAARLGLVAAGRGDVDALAPRAVGREVAARAGGRNADRLGETARITDAFAAAVARRGDDDDAGLGGFLDRV